MKSFLKALACHVLSAFIIVPLALPFIIIVALAATMFFVIVIYEKAYVAMKVILFNHDQDYLYFRVKKKKVLDKASKVCYTKTKLKERGK